MGSAVGSLGPHDPSTIAGATGAEEVEFAELAALLDRAMALLPPETRRLLVERLLDETPQARVALRLGLTISNRTRSPAPVVAGQTARDRAGQRCGFIFFNEEGGECGGLTYSGPRAAAGGYNAFAGLMLDQYKQDQIVGLQYFDRTGGERSAGLYAWERPEVPLSEVMACQEALERLPEGAEKTGTRDRLHRQAKIGRYWPTRVFVGKLADNVATIRLADADGRVRLRLTVDAAGTPALEFLDETGRVVERLPNPGPAAPTAPQWTPD